MMFYVEQINIIASPCRGRVDNPCCRPGRHSTSPNAHRTSPLQGFSPPSGSPSVILPSLSQEGPDLEGPSYRLRHLS